VSANPLAPAWLSPPDDVDGLAPAVWPASARRGDDGAIEIAGVPVTSLAAEFGTPLYVLDEGEARGRAARIRSAFESAAAEHAGGAAVHVYYAGKALLTTDVARWMADEGLRVDVCTGGELAVALAAGVDPARLGFHGNSKTLGEIDRAVGVGVGTIVLDSRVEVDRVADAAARHGRRQAVRLRINSGVHASTHEYLATAREDQKFGIALADAADVVAAIRARGELEFLGLHSHIGSQIFAADGFAEAAQRLVALHAELLEGGPVPELNLGGGFGIAYTSADDPEPIERIAHELVRAVAAACAAAGVAVPALAIEPGRAIVGPAGVTLYEVGTIKDVLVSHAAGTAVRRYVSVDGGMSDNLRTALYGADYTARLASRASGDEAALVRVAGRHCESGDIVVRDDYLPADVEPGDLLAVPATGAYCFSLASNYNHVVRPAVVAVRDGVARVLVRRETEDDLLSRDTGAAR
jgi:diaminopimelate decarboxylase